MEFILGEDVISNKDLHIIVEVWDFAMINHFKVSVCVYTYICVYDVYILW